MSLYDYFLSFSRQTPYSNQRDQRILKNIDEYLQTLSENGSIIEYKEKNVYFHIYYPLNLTIIRLLANI